jgi:hypothetical protein
MRLDNSSRVVGAEPVEVREVQEARSMTMRSQTIHEPLGRDEFVPAHPPLRGVAIVDPARQQ